VLVCIGWVFFRAATFSDSVYVLRQMFAIHPSGTFLIPAWLLTLAGISLIAALTEDAWAWIERMTRAPAWVYAAVIAILLLSVEMIGVTGKPVPFVYYQF
jgi:hypothetical protein